MHWPTVEESRGAVGCRQLLTGLAMAVTGVGIVAGAFLLSGIDSARVLPSPTVESTAIFWLSPVPPSSTPSIPSVPTQTSATVTLEGMTPALVTETPTQQPLEIAAMPTAQPLSPTGGAPTAVVQRCTPPAGWIPYIVQRGDTLTGLALRTGTTPYALMQANCLRSAFLLAGQRLFLPTVPAYSTPVYPVPTPSPSCGPPAGWIVYTVQAGDTLYSLAVRTGTTVEAIRQANCLMDYTIRIGQRLYLPRPPVITVTPTPTSTPSPTASPTATVTPTASPTPTETPTWTPTPTPTVAPVTTVTPTSTMTMTAEPSPTSS